MVRLWSHLAEVVTDSFAAPRYVHHLVKVLTGALVLGLSWLAAISLTPFAVACLFSLVWFASNRVEYWLDHGGAFWKRDLFCDLSLHTLAFCGALALRGVYFAAAWGAAALVAVYFLTVWGAEP